MLKKVTGWKLGKSTRAILKIYKYANAEMSFSSQYQSRNKYDYFTRHLDSAPSRPTQENLDCNFEKLFQSRNERELIRCSTDGMFDENILCKYRFSSLPKKWQDRKTLPAPARYDHDKGGKLYVMLGKGSWFYPRA